MPNKDYIVVGKILNTHGIKGWLIIRSYTHPVENIFEYDLSTNSSDGFQELRIDEYRILPKKVIIKIKSIDTINDTEPYINQEIFVSKQNLPVTDKNEYYLDNGLLLDQYYKDNTGGKQITKNEGILNYFKNNNYNTNFIYGGRLNFDNMFKKKSNFF